MAANRIWIDVESSGLDPEAGVLLEVAVVATTADAEYRELAHQSWVIGYADRDDVWWREHLDPVVYDMHTKSGLLLEVPFGQPLAHVEHELCRFVDFFGNPAPGREPVAGASVHFDTRWCSRHMPRFMKRFSHRVFDTSTLKQLFRDVGRGAELPSDTAPAHRALADIRYCITVARTVARALHRR